MKKRNKWNVIQTDIQPIMSKCYYFNICYSNFKKYDNEQIIASVKIIHHFLSNESLYCFKTQIEP